jgi:hypothetical protein
VTIKLDDACFQMVGWDVSSGGVEAVMNCRFLGLNAATLDQSVHFVSVAHEESNSDMVIKLVRLVMWDWRARRFARL